MFKSSDVRLADTARFVPRPRRTDDAATVAALAAVARDFHSDEDRLAARMARVTARSAS